MIKGVIEIKEATTQQNVSMQDTVLTIFLVDDHPIIINGFATIIDNIQTIGYQNHFIRASNCEEAVNNMTLQKAKDKNIDIAIVDIGLPPFRDLKSGSDIIVLIKDWFPSCKIIILTAFIDPMLIYNLLQKITIEAILCKSDVDHQEFIDIYKNVLSGEHFRSKTIIRTIKEIAQRTMNFDHYDLEILQKMTDGIRTKDLPLYIPLGISAIEKRKTNMKLKLLKYGGNNNELIASAKRTGLI